MEQQQEQEDYRKRQELKNYRIYTHDEISGEILWSKPVPDDWYSTDYINKKTELLSSYMRGNSEAGEILDDLWDLEFEAEFLLEQMRNKRQEKN